MDKKKNPKKGEYGYVWFIENDLVKKVSRKKLNINNVYETPDIRESIFYSCIDHPFIGKIHSIKFRDSIELTITKYEEITKDKISFMRFIEEIAIVLKYIHRYDITHRDLKPQNILIGKDGSIRIIDWGLVGFGKSFSHYNAYFTIWFRPIEMLNGKKGISTKGDIWSLAITALYIYYDFRKYLCDIREESEMVYLMKQLFGKGPTMEKIQNIFRTSAEEAFILSEMLNFDPEKRWSPDLILDFMNSRGSDNFNPDIFIILRKYNIPSFIKWYGVPNCSNSTDILRDNRNNIFNWLAKFSYKLGLSKRSLITSIIIFNSYLYKKNNEMDFNSENIDDDIKLIAISSLYISSIIYDSDISDIDCWIKDSKLHEPKKNMKIICYNMMYQAQDIMIVEKGQLIFDLVMNLIEHTNMKKKIDEFLANDLDKNFYYLFLLLNLNMSMDYAKCIEEIKSGNTSRQISNMLNILLKKSCFTWFVKNFKVHV